MRPLACFRAGKQALTDKNVPRRFVVSTLSNSAPLITSSLAAGKIPALAHRMSRLPYRSTAVAAIAFVSASSLTSALKALALPFASVISLATLSLSVLLRATTRTEQPTDPKRRAIPRPIPLLAPVTTAVRPASELNIENSVLRSVDASRFQLTARRRPSQHRTCLAARPPQERLQRAAQQLAQGGGDSLPVAGLAVLEPAEAFHEIERHTVDFDRKYAGTTLQPL